MTDPVVTTGKSEHVHDLLSAFINGDLDDAERLAVSTHLEECEACQADYASLRFTVAALHQLPPAARPRDFLISAPPARQPSTFSRVRMWSGALAALLAVVVGARLLFPPTPAPLTSAPAQSGAPAAAQRPSAIATGSQTNVNSGVPAPPPVPAAAPTSTTAPSPKSGAASSVAPSGLGVARSSSTTPGSAPNPPLVPAAAPAPPNSPDAYPAAQSAPATTTASEAYPAPVAPQAGPSVTAYPAPATALPPPAPGDANYPAPTAAPASPPAVTPPGSTGPVQTSAPPRETTWFTPAVGILGVLVVGTAIVLWILGRRSS